MNHVKSGFFFASNRNEIFVSISNFASEAKVRAHPSGSSQRRMNAACPKFDMVWLYRSPIPVGRRGIISSFKFFLPAFATRRGRREGVGTL